MTSSTIGDTALVVLVPEADPAIGKWRALFDSSAHEHMPAHVTVLYPFTPVGLIDDAEIAAMREFFARQRHGELIFNAIESWPGVLWLDPQSQECLELLDRTHRRWPEHLPYGRTDIEPVPHLTIGVDIPETKVGRVRDEIGPQLPLVSRLDAVDLMVFDGVRWESRRRFPLGG